MREAARMTDSFRDVPATEAVAELGPGTDGFEGPCWCGEENAWFSDLGLEDGCAGTGTLHCFCGGDLCVCHNHGGIECPGCDDCEAVTDADDEMEASYV